MQASDQGLSTLDAFRWVKSEQIFNDFLDFLGYSMVSPLFQPRQFLVKHLGLDRRSDAHIAGAHVAEQTDLVAAEKSHGKDTPSGHWEMAGLPVTFDWGLFPKTVPTFPPYVISTLIERGGLPGILGNCHASGTEIIERLGVEQSFLGP